MIRINIAYWSRTATAFHDLLTIKAGESLNDIVNRVVVAYGAVLGNHGEHAVIRLTTSKQAATDLKNKLDELFKDLSRSEPLTDQEVDSIHRAVTTYRGILEAELETIDAYYVKQKGIYSTPYLIDAAEQVLPLELVVLLPKEAREDLQSSGRCLAFELPTAAGFHVARATETVIRLYMAAMKCPDPKESQRNWGQYIDLLTKAHADEKIVHHIKQIKDLHRNPLIHPEVTLSMAEALVLWTLCTGLIFSMMETCKDALAKVIAQVTGSSAEATKS